MLVLRPGLRILPVRRDQFNTLLFQMPGQLIAVIGFIADDLLRNLT